MKTMNPRRLPAKGAFPRSESAFERNLTKEDREALLQLQTLRQLPKAKYATESCLTGLPSGRGRKVVYSHIEIYKMVEDIATDLREAGVRPQTVCGFILNNSIEAIVYFLALQWIGAIAVPIDPSLSDDELALTLRDTQTFAVVSSLVDEDEQAGDETFQKVKRVCLSTEIIHWYISRSTNKGVFLERNGLRAGEGAAWAGGAGDFKLDPSETSVRMALHKEGKCFVVDSSHRTMASSTREYSNTYQLGAQMSTLLIFPVHEINGLLAVLATIHSGGNVVVAEGASIEPSAVVKHAVEQKISWFSAHPDTITRVFNEDKDRKSLQSACLAFVQSIGNGIPASTMQQMEPVFRAQVLEAYGCPEACGIITANRDHNLKLETFGTNVHGCEVGIFDDDGQQLPPETVGNVGVCGQRVIRSYGNDVATIKELFVTIEDSETNKKFFLTGDRGALSTDGYLKLKEHCRLPVDPVALAAASAAALAAAEMQREQLMRDEKARQSLAEKEQDDKENERRRQQEEEEENRAREERKKADEASLLADRSLISDSDDEIIESSSECVEDSDELSFSRNKMATDTATATDSVSVSRKSSLVDVGLNNDAFEKIMDRLDRIERNQTRLESEIEAAHRLEMQRMRELLEKSEQERAPPSGQQVDMDAINSVLKSAVASAESSSQNTAAAAKAARDAAEAAAQAAAAQAAAARGNSSSVLEVQDPNAIQKAVLVSLEEVEDAMKVHPSVACARAFGRPDKRYGMEVFCAIRPCKGARLSDAWLKLHAQTVLPAACVPKKFFYKESLREGEERQALADDHGMKRMSEFAGYHNGPKVVRAPSWTPPKPKVVTPSK